MMANENPGDTKHTVQLQLPSSLEMIPLNRAAQVAFGSFILFVAIKLWWGGWFSLMTFKFLGVDQPTDGLGFTGGLGLVALVLDSLALVGILGFALIRFVLQGTLPIVASMTDWVSQSRAGVAAKVAGQVAATGTATDTAKSTAKKRTADPEKIAAKFRIVQDVINQLHFRTLAIEQLHPELKPDPEPEPLTAEQLQEQLAEVRQQLADLQSEAKPEEKPSTRSRSRKT